MWKMHAEGMGLISGPGRSSGEGNGNSIQYSCLGNPMDRGAWWVTVVGVTTTNTFKTIITHNTNEWTIHLYKHGCISKTAHWVKEARHKRVYTVDSEIGSSNLWGHAAWCALAHGVAKSWTWFSNWTELNLWGEKVRSSSLLDGGHGYT